MKKSLKPIFIGLLLIGSMLIGSFSFSMISSGEEPASSERMTFTSGIKIDFTSSTEMTFKKGTAMQFWSGVKMAFGTNTSIRFIEIDPNGWLEQCDWLQILWPLTGYLPEACSWWEVFDPETGKPIGEFHVDFVEPPDLFHIDFVLPDILPIPVGAEIRAVKKIDIIEPCDYFEVHWPSDWYPELVGGRLLIQKQASQLAMSFMLTGQTRAVNST